MVTGSSPVNSQEIDSIKNYIENQHEHHKEKIFQDEYRLLMKEHHIDIDERYVWE